jgi:phosphatidylglycerophosphate synthase
MRVEQAVILIPERKPGTSLGKGMAGKRLLGLTLIQRTVLAAAQAGIREFVLSGRDLEESEKLAAGLRADRRVLSRALRVDSASLAELARPGISERLRDRFWLFPADAVFDPEILLRASCEDPGGGSALHLVDARSGASREEGVRLTGGAKDPFAARFTDLADGAPAVYTGISLCPRGILRRMDEVLSGSAQLRSDGLNALFKDTPGRSLDIEGRFCLRVTSKTSSHRAERYLLNTVRKPTDGFFSRHFNRHISLFLTKRILRFNITPIQLSVVSILIGLASGLLIGMGGYRFAVLGAFLFEFASIFDGCDGENARLTYRTSKIGGFLDIIGDATIFILFFLSLPIGLYRSSLDPTWLYLGTIAFFSMGLFYLQVVRYMKRAQLGSNIIAIVKDIEGSAGRAGFGSRADAIAAKIAFIYRRDFFSTVVFIAIAAGGAGILMWVLAVLMPVEAIYIIAYARKRLGRALEPA